MNRLSNGNTILFITFYSTDDDDDDVIYIGTFSRDVNAIDAINAAIGHISINEVKNEATDDVNIDFAASTAIKDEVKEEPL